LFLHRKDLFAEVFHPIFHEGMRADPSWTAGEDELKTLGTKHHEL
jgi:hypothetical protein